MSHGRGSVSPPNLASQPPYSGFHSVISHLSPLSSFEYLAQNPSLIISLYLSVCGNEDHSTFLLQHERKKVKSLSHVRLFATPWTVATRLLRPWNFPGKSSVMDCRFLLQRIFLTQGSSPGLLHCREMLYRLSHQVIPQGGLRAPGKPLNAGSPTRKLPSHLLFSVFR